uniref:Uncharacterized protein n=1 Tax=Avena sativa TaxID=4498 RepID=A0ACD5WLS4_AVESA
MKRRTFNYICCLVKSMEDVSRYTFRDGKVICWEDQVAVALRMLISGGPAETVASDFSIKRSTISLVTFRFVEAMMKRGGYHMRWSDSIKMENMKSKFDLIHMLPNCCGVIDTTFISSAEPNRDHEKSYSMAVQVVVDLDMRFIDYTAEWSGTKDQSSILHGSLICTEREEGEWLNGGKVKLSDGSEVGEYIIGDAGFPLLPWLLTPYREKDLSDPEVEFNRRLSVVRAITLRGLARLKDTWKCLHGEFWRPENPHEFSDIIMVCCMLHNIVMYQTVAT